MLFVVVSLGQKPEFIAAIVEPFLFGRREVFARKLGIDEEVGMSCETDLYYPASILWHDEQLDPLIRDLLCMPTLVVHGIDMTLRALRSLRHSAGLRKDLRSCRRAEGKNEGERSHLIGGQKSCHDRPLQRW